VAKNYIDIIESYMASVVYEVNRNNEVKKNMVIEKSEIRLGEIELEDQVRMGYLREKYDSLNKK